LKAGDKRDTVFHLRVQGRLRHEDKACSLLELTKLR
jgi:hypothetical protein